MLKSLKQSIHFMQQSTGVQEVKLKMLFQPAVVIPFSDPGSDLLGLFNYNWLFLPIYSPSFFLGRVSVINYW